MQSLTSRFPINCDASERFAFAGFDWPRFVAMLPRGDIKTRLARHRKPCTGPYYHAPRPLDRENQTLFFYLDSDFMPSLRWQYCDDVARSISHSGWFTDDDGAGDTIRGIVARLPHGRGFIAGWTMGEGMASVLDYKDVFHADDEIGAALCADSMAENAAEHEREYQEELDDEDESGRYVAGWNMPGYLPESEPETFSEFDDAKAYIIDTLKSFEDDEGAAGDEDKAIDFCHAAEDANLWQESDTRGRIVAAGNLVFWIVESE